MKTIHYILYALATLILVSCYDDKGNYDYTAIPDVVVDTVGCGIRSSYALDRFDRLTLEPKVKVDGQTADDSKLNYVWTMYSATSGTGADTAIDTLGHERRLDAQLTKAGGSYIIQLSVTYPLTESRRSSRSTAFWRKPSPLVGCCFMSQLHIPAHLT